MVPPMTPSSSSHFCHFPSSPTGAGPSGFSPSGFSSSDGPSPSSSSSSGFSPSGFSPSGFSSSDGPSSSSSSSSIAIPQFPSSLFHAKVPSLPFMHLVFDAPSTTSEPSS